MCDLVTILDMILEQIDPNYIKSNGMIKYKMS